MFRKYWWILLAMPPAGGILGLMAAAVISYVQPKIYQSQAIIETKPAAMDPDPHGRFLATEMARIESRAVLEPVIDELELTMRWNLDKESALGVLNRIIHVENIRGTDLIAIRVRHTNMVDARDIADSVANSYKRLRNEAETAIVERRLDELQKTVRDQEDRVEEHRKILSTIVRTKNGNVSEIRESQDYIDAKREFETQQEFLNEMKIKLMGETISTKIPGERVMVHEPPVVARVPVLPNVPRNLLSGIAYGVVFSIPCALLLMWLLHLGSTKRALSQESTPPPLRPTRG
ncbi:MAG TPA: hypothetical protein VLO11_00390 [Luteolibacter sp.]|nr:hypothetical protein [Luteolibacter sp.]